jgi:hypothetical protein
VVLGDDLSARAAELRERDLTEMFSGARFPQRCASINAYLGALPIAQALGEGCDVVITGRCVDSAVTLGVLVHEFGWKADDYDRWRRARWPATLSNAVRSATAACSPTGKRCRDWDDHRLSRSSRQKPMAASSSPR